MYDVIIIGAGPAGIFAALELSKDKTRKILIIEKGNDFHDRIKRKDKKDSVCGFAGAGAFSDGKLTLNPEVGGTLPELIGYAESKKVIDYVDDIYKNYGAPEKTFEAEKRFFTRIKRDAGDKGLKLIQDVIRHMGTDGNIEVMMRMRTELEKRGVDFRFNHEVEDVGQFMHDNGNSRFVVFSNNAKHDTKESFKCDKLIVAPGRSGSGWFRNVAKTLGIELSTQLPVVDLGVRVEVPNYCVEHLTAAMYEPKFIYYSKKFDVKVRTFCVCPGGHVALEYHDEGVNGGFWTVNGHSNKDHKTDVTNFAILASEKFTEPFDDPTSYGRKLAKLSNMLCDKVIVQRFVDLERGRRSTPERIRRLSYQPTLKECQPGDLSLVIPYRQMTAIIEMMHALSGVMPGLIEEAILYGLEVKFYSNKYNLSNNMESNIPGLYIVGDGSGLTRSLIQASCAGVLAARGIMK